MEYIGSTDTAIISAMTTHNPLPTTIGCSWGWTPADPTTLDPYFEKMAAQGQTFFAASGDDSTWSSRNEAWPADDANVVSVGGTDLVTASAAGPWQSETAWSDSGGGISPDSIAIPAWQQLAGVINSSNRGSTSLRNGPDVSANANFTYYVCADQIACTANEYGGTSFATPLWAAYIALANQQLADNGGSTIGFINPMIYAQNVSGGALSAAYAVDFHDITSGTSGSYSAVTGYRSGDRLGQSEGNRSDQRANSDEYNSRLQPCYLARLRQCDGWEQRHIRRLLRPSLGALNSAIALTASGAPRGVTASLSSTPIAAPGSGTSTLTLAVASTTATGTYTITVTGTGGGITQTATVSLTVTAATAGSFTISVSPTSGSLHQGHVGMPSLPRLPLAASTQR